MKTWLPAALALALCGWCNLLYGYAAGLTLLLMAVMARRYRAVACIGAVGFVAALPKFYWWWEMRPYLTVPPDWGRAWMVDSFGAHEVLKRLAMGEVFDHARLPVLTVLVGAGIAAAVWRSR